jgi:hypothetical protein
VFENRVLRKVFGSKRDEVIGGWGKMHNEEDELAGHVARMGRSGMHIGFWWESQKKIDH